jgi:hypothetical protein
MTQRPFRGPSVSGFVLHGRKHRERGAHRQLAIEAFDPVIRRLGIADCIGRSTHGRLPFLTFQVVEGFAMSKIGGLFKPMLSVSGHHFPVLNPGPPEKISYLSKGPPNQNLDSSIDDCL